MRKICFFLAMLCSTVLLATPLEPKVQLINANTARIYWDGYGTYQSFTLVVSPEEQTGNPEYWKGVHYLTADETSFVATGLLENHQYYVYLSGMENDVAQDWVSITFTPRDVNMCELHIEMRCSFVTWNGQGFYINEGDNAQFFTYSGGFGGSSTETYVSEGAPLSIVWHKEDSGGMILLGNSSFTITDAAGNILVDISESDFSGLTDGQVLYQGTICQAACPATISDLKATVYGTAFNITWDAENADHFEVAVLRKSNPTNEEKEAAAVVTDQTSYAFTGVLYAGYNVYVRAICADGEKGNWNNLLAFGEMPYSMDLVAAIAEPITMNYNHTGDILEDGLIGTTPEDDIYPLRVFELDLADSTDVTIFFTSDDIQTMFFAIYQDPGDGQPWETVAGGPYSEMMELPKLKGLYYIMMDAENAIGQYSVMIRTRQTLEPKALPLEFVEQGDFTDATIWDTDWNPPYFDGVLAKAFSITPEDTTNVYVIITSQDLTGMNGSIMFWAYKDSLISDSIFYYDPAGVGFDMTLDKGHTYYFVLAAVPSKGGKPTYRYAFTMYPRNTHGDVTLTPKPITLNFKESTDFTDAEEWTMVGTTLLAKAYSITPADTIEVIINMESEDVITTGQGLSVTPSIMAMIFRNGMGMSDQIAGTIPGSQTTQILLKDSTYYIVVASAPDYGGKATDSYTLRITLVDTVAPAAIPVTPDAYIDGEFESYYDTFGKFTAIYEYKATKEQRVSYSIEIPGKEKDDMSLLLGLTQVRVYKDTLADEGFASSSNSAYYDYGQSLTLNEGHTYYFALTSPDLTAYRFILRAEPDYDHLPVKGELAVGMGYRSALSVKDGFTYHDMAHCYTYDWNGPFEAYQVPMEKDKHYIGLMHVLAANGDGIENTFNGIASTIFTPGAQQGSYEENYEISDCNHFLDDDIWTVVDFEPDTTAVDTIMFDAYFTSKHFEDSIIYEFSVEEVQTFTHLVETAPFYRSDELPVAEAGVFSDNAKVLIDPANHFHDTPQTYIEDEAAIFDALARIVRLAAGQTLYVEFGGDADAVIQFYDGTTLLNTIDETPYSYPFESGEIKNETTDSLDIIVVCSFNGVHIADKAWSMRMTTDKQDFTPKLAEPVADRESITLYESDGVAEALEALSQVVISMVDMDGNFICHVPNNRFAWNVYFDDGSAWYEVNDQDLPMGYALVANNHMWVVVLIERIPDLPTGFINTDFDENAAAQKILRDGQVYIIRDGMIYTIMGQRVR